MNTAPANIKAIIWDMGGVLIRTENRQPRTALAARYGLTYEMLESIVYGSRSAGQATIGSISSEEHWKSVQSLLKIPDESLEDFKNEFWGGDELDKALVKRIDQLRPEYKTALLSNAWDDARENVGRKHEFLYAFDVSVFSAEVEMAKPNANFYEWMLDQLQVSADEAIFVDDMLENVIAAIDLGIHGIRFIDREQTIKDLQAMVSF
ncbi:MAG: HAD family phosphatase [Anaerolineaceae bacterium]|nr:HAD family phosphatase [Anaerolineaceae bacterium]